MFDQITLYIVCNYSCIFVFHELGTSCRYWSFLSKSSTMKKKTMSHQKRLNQIPKHMVDTWFFELKHRCGRHPVEGKFSPKENRFFLFYRQKTQTLCFQKWMLQIFWRVLDNFHKNYKKKYKSKNNKIHFSEETKALVKIKVNTEYYVGTKRTLFFESFILRLTCS